MSAEIKNDFDKAIAYNSLEAELLLGKPNKIQFKINSKQFESAPYELPDPTSSWSNAIIIGIPFSGKLAIFLEAKAMASNEAQTDTVLSILLAAINSFFAPNILGSWESAKQISKSQISLLSIFSLFDMSSTRKSYSFVFNFSIFSLHPKIGLRWISGLIGVSPILYCKCGGSDGINAIGYSD